MAALKFPIGFGLYAGYPQCISLFFLLNFDLSSYFCLLTKNGTIGSFFFCFCFTAPLCNQLTSVVRCLTGHATGGGGHLGVTVFATGGDTKNFFEKLIVFGVLARAVENAKNYRLFEKFFRVPPPPVANTVTPKCPPPVACPVRHNFDKFLNFLTFLVGLVCFIC